MGKFYIVATPIGNLEDVTLRAIRMLKEVDLVLCEDTRVTRKLLSHYGISKKVESYHARSKSNKLDTVIRLIREGKDIAYVTDAGTPAISDPGSELVAKVKELLSDVEVIAIPGASALTSALSVSGLPASEFLFLGFLPHKKGRETLFKEITESKRTVVFYESPHRLMKTLHSLSDHLAAQPPSERKVVIARELTKIHEEIISGSPLEVLNYFKENPDKVRGEFVIVVERK